MELRFFRRVAGVCRILTAILPALPAGWLRAAEPVPARHGMVVSSHALASQAGIEVMREGGNAVDAAIATGMTLAVVHPSAGNIGGGGFMVVRMADGRTAALDFREKAPFAATATMFLDESGAIAGDSNHEGWKSVGVPGTVAGFDLARERFGTMPWSRLTARAIRLAADGFPLSAAMAREFEALRADWEREPSSAAVFLKADGTPWREGDIWRQPDLAETLERIARNGRAGFYFGITAGRLAEAMRLHGGLITVADLAAYEAKERTPLQGTYRGFTILSMPPPSSGGLALIEMLNILEGYDLPSWPFHSAQHLHVLAETMRLAYADRARYAGDPDFNPDMPVDRLISKDYAASLRGRIDMARAGKSSPADVEEVPEGEQTTHYSVVDPQGNAVVVTYTLEYSYGSRIVAPGLGFLLNNEMGDFNPKPGLTTESGLIGTGPNLVAPGKRMLSSMTPTIVLRDGAPWLLTGSPGGRTIINTVLQVVSNAIDFRMDVAEAVAAPRIHHQWLPDVLRAEDAVLNGATKAALEAAGHRIRSGGRQGRAHSILIDPDTGMRLGAADGRDPDGAAAGW